MAHVRIASVGVGFGYARTIVAILGDGGKDKPPTPAEMLGGESVVEHDIAPVVENTLGSQAQATTKILGSTHIWLHASSSAHSGHGTFGPEGIHLGQPSRRQLGHTIILLYGVSAPQYGHLNSIAIIPPASS